MQTDHPLNAESRPMEAPSTHPVIRTPDQRVRVFVSSTLDELAPERAAAREAITQLRLTPVLFELGARPYPPRELYRAYLAQSDIFIGLYWQRYGWVAPTMQVSGLEDEYQLSGEKPKLIYIKAPAPEREPRLKDLLEQIKNTASYKYFATSAELRELIANDLILLLTERFEAPAQRALPSGTVSFLFTDIEGSTNLAQQYPDALPSLMAQHHAILHQAMAAPKLSSARSSNVGARFGHPRRAGLGDVDGDQCERQHRDRDADRHGRGS